MVGDEPLNPSLAAWLSDAALLVGLALSTGCLVYGLALLLAPAATSRTSAWLNRRYSSRRALRPFEIPRHGERFFYRHHRLSGSLILAGVILFFVLYAVELPRTGLAARLAADFDRTLAETLVDGISAFLLISNALIGVFAIVVITRPSALKPIEAWANRWISTRRAALPAERSREPVDRWAASHPRLAGGLVAIGSLYVVASLLMVVTQ